MQQGNVYRNTVLVGLISKDDDGRYRFVYDQEYLKSVQALAISVNLPLQTEPFLSYELFAFFYNMLAEGTTKALQCQSLRIDEHDHFTRLLKTTESNTIGAVTVKGVTVSQVNIESEDKL